MSCWKTFASRVVSLLCSLVFVFLLSVSLPAQQSGQSFPLGSSANHDADSKDQIVNLLSSSVAKDRAWGAYLVGRRHYDDLVPNLLKLFDAGFKDQDYETQMVYRCALDSLIQLNVTVPSKSLLPLFDHFQPEAIILAASAPKEHEQEMLVMMQSNVSRAEWIGLGNMLSQMKTPGFAAMLLGDLHIAVLVGVVSDSNHGVGGGGSGGGYCGDGVITIPEGFPTVAFYHIDERAQGGSVVLSSGATAIYYTRKLLGPGQHGVGDCGTAGDYDSIRLQYIASMLDTSVEDLKLNSRPEETIIWTGPDKYERELSQITDRIKNAYKQLVSRAAENQLLSKDEAKTLRPKITMHIMDSRDDKSIALPGAVDRY